MSRYDRTTVRPSTKSERRRLRHAAIRRDRKKLLAQGRGDG